MLTPPDDLPEPVVRDALAAGWSLTAATLDYRAVGFGAHHWAVVDAGGRRWFVSVVDLRKGGFDQLLASLTAATALRDSGCDFVVAPVGAPVVRVGEFYAVTVYPHVEGESFGWDDYSDSHRAAMLDLVVAVHAAPASVRDLACADDYAIPAGGPVRPQAGPYGPRVAELDLSPVSAATARYGSLVDGVRSSPPEMVLTHGEPHPGNTMRAGGRWLLIDWETAMVAPPERDVWQLDGMQEAYTAATGVVLRADALELYRLRWDLSEIAEGLAWFAAPHGDTEDDRETWDNLVESLGNLSATPIGWYRSRAER